MVKKGYYGNGGSSFAWTLGVNFLDIPNCAINEFYFFFKLDLKKVLLKKV